MRVLSPLAIKRLLVLASSVLVSLVIGVVIIEVWAIATSKDNEQWHDPNSRFDSELGWAPKPSQTLDRVWAGKHLTTNRFGFRSEEIDSTKRQIAVLGDSVAWGFGLNDDETVSFYLDELVKPTGYQVQNLGVSGYGTDQQYLFLKRHIADLPNLSHLVLLIYTGNDLYECALNRAYGKRKPFFVLEGEALVQPRDTISKYCLGNLLSLSPGLARVSSANDRIAGFLGWLAGDIERDVEDTKPVVRALIREISSLADQRGAEFLLVISPPIVDFDVPTESYEFFVETARLDGYPMVNLMEVFAAEEGDNLESFYRPQDPAHLAPKGNQLLAQTLKKALFPENAR